MYVSYSLVHFICARLHCRTAHSCGADHAPPFRDAFRNGAQSAASQLHIGLGFKGASASQLRSDSPARESANQGAMAREESNRCVEGGDHTASWKSASQRPHSLSEQSSELLMRKSRKRGGDRGGVSDLSARSYRSRVGEGTKGALAIQPDLANGASGTTRLMAAMAAR